MSKMREVFVPGVGPVIDRRPGKRTAIDASFIDGLLGADKKLSTRERVREILSSRGWNVTDADLDEIEEIYRG